MMKKPMQAALHSTEDQLTTRLPLLWVSMAFLGGIILASLISAWTFIWLILAAAAILLAFGARRFLELSFVRSSHYTLLAVSLGALFLGAARYQWAQPKITVRNIAFYNDRAYDVFVTGWVAEMPDERDTYTNLRIHVEAVDTGNGDAAVGGLILARVGVNETFHYGDLLRLRGSLQTPPSNEDFSYQDYLAREGILSYMPSAEATVLPGQRGNFITAAVYALKSRSLANIYHLFPDPEASLLAGILLGVDTGLTSELQSAFKNTGTAHIIAISGFNISIIAAIFVSIFSRALGQRRGAILAVVAIAFYTVLVGADAAVVRAALMGGLSLFARQVGRRNFGLNTLASVAFIMAVINPLVLWDVGFQLSFFATLGLILYTEPLTAWASSLIARFASAETAQKIVPPLSDFVLLTLAAQIATLPIMAYQFQRISLVSLIANPFILPVQPAVMIIGGLALLLSLVYFPLGQLTAWIAWPFVEYTIHMVELFNRIPHGTILLGNFSIWFAVLFYVTLLSMTFGWSRIKEFFASLTARVRNLSFITILIALFALGLLVWRSAFAAPDGKLHITFLSVGSANAVLIQTPGGRAALVNGGPSTSQLSDELGRRLPIFRRKLDWLIVGSTDEDQVAALPRVLDRYPPDHVLWSGNVQASYSARQLDQWLADHNTPVTRAETGQKLDLGDGALIEVQSVGPRGSVLLIQWKDFRALLPIGVSADTLENLEYGNVIGPVDVLLLADSGYSATNTVDWVQNLNPKLIVLSVAAGDPDGLPDQAALDAVGGYNLLRTDRNGWISISTDGNTMDVNVERK